MEGRRLSALLVTWSPMVITRIVGILCVLPGRHMFLFVGPPAPSIIRPSWTSLKIGIALSIPSVACNRGYK